MISRKLGIISASDQLWCTELSKLRCHQLCLLELRPILPAVTPLALLALWLAFPAVTPQH